MTFSLRISLFLFLLLMQGISTAQPKRDTLVSYYLELAKSKNLDTNYAEAFLYFKKIFSLNAVVPDELAYHYGYTQFKLKNNAASKEALNKYLSLKGDTGTFFKESKYLLREIDCNETGYYDALVECELCYGDKTISINCRNCKGKGIETCIVCKGAGVLKSQGNFSTTYQTCTRCAGEKIIKCTVCKSLLKENVVCYSCNGIGRKKIRKKCPQ